MLFLNTLDVSAAVIGPQHFNQSYSYTWSYSLDGDPYTTTSGYITSISGGGGTVKNGTGTISSNSGGNGTISSSYYYRGGVGVMHWKVPLQIGGTFSGSFDMNDPIIYALALGAYNISCTDANVVSVCLTDGDGNIYSMAGNSKFNFGTLQDVYSNMHSCVKFYYLEFDVLSEYSSNANPLKYVVTCNLTTYLDIYPNDSSTYGQIVQDPTSNQHLDSIETSSESTASSSSGILSKVTEFFGSFFSNLIGVFVPEDGYFSDWFTRLNTLLADKLGMLYAPFDLLIQVLTSILNADDSFVGIPFPGIEWDGQYLVEPFTFTFSSLGDVYSDLQGYVYFGTDVILLLAFFGLLQDKIKHILED